MRCLFYYGGKADCREAELLSVEQMRDVVGSRYKYLGFLEVDNILHKKNER